jgi:RNA polymerase-binding transcription factor DksA
MTIDTKHFETKLLDEKAILEKELAKVARKNPDRVGDWEATPEEKDPSQADENISADSIDGYESNNAIVNTLEPRWRDTNAALARIKKGTYGLCEVCEKEIETDRLEANPAASTCKKHKK